MNATQKTISLRSFFPSSSDHSTTKGSNRLATFTALLALVGTVLSFDSSRAFAGAGSGGGQTIYQKTTTDFGLVAVETTVNGTINGTSADTYTYNGMLFVGPNLQANVNGYTVAELLTADFPPGQDNGTLTWTLPDFGSSGTAVASKSSLDALNNFVSTSFGITSFSGVSGFGLGNPVGNTFTLDAASQADGVLNGLSKVGAIGMVPGSAETISAVSTTSTVQVTFGTTTTSGFTVIDGVTYALITTTTYVGEVAITSYVVSGIATPSYSPPVCNLAVASIPFLWSPKHTFVSEDITGVTASAPRAVSIKITKIQQDEPTLGLGSGDMCPDGKGIGQSTAEVRAERSGTGGGRVYHINFTGTDSEGGTCSGAVTVCVPHDQSQIACGDEGPKYDSTKCQ